MTHKEIQQKATEAMRAKNTAALNTYRSLLAAFTNELVAKKRKPTEELDEEEIQTVIQRSAKQRKDSIEQFIKGNRADLVASEEEELKTLQELLPPQMPKEEIQKIAQQKKEELRIMDKSKMGMLMGAIMKEVKGKANGDDVKAVVESFFS
ncbi:MAG: GatB/YqeY domain-containing protein [Candidatus Pacebacteria bacterium]|nr:GatB/YqeY domain-containing protein [Candidatus Paceibacterota bacterium]